MLFSRLRRLVQSEVTAARRRWADRDGSEPEAEEKAEPRSGRRRAHARRAGPPKEDPMAKHYARLEVPVGSDLATVKAGYRALMKRYHPDRHSRDAEKSRVANEVAMALTESFEALSRHLERR